MLWRMSVYSMDLRRKVVAADGTLAEVGRRFGVDPRTVRAWRRRAADGALEPRRGGNPGTLRVLTPIPADTPRPELLRRLEAEIEPASRALEAAAPYPLPQSEPV